MENADSSHPLLGYEPNHTVGVAEGWAHGCDVTLVTGQMIPNIEDRGAILRRDIGNELEEGIQDELYGENEMSAMK